MRLLKITALMAIVAEICLAFLFGTGAWTPVGSDTLGSEGALTPMIDLAVGSWLILFAAGWIVVTISGAFSGRSGSFVAGRVVIGSVFTIGVMVLGSMSVFAAETWQDVLASGTVRWRDCAVHEYSQTHPEPEITQVDRIDEALDACHYIGVDLAKSMTKVDKMWADEGLVDLMNETEETLRQMLLGLPE